jgi:predicted permease
VDWRMLYANPLLWSTVLGIACSQAHINVPVWLATPLGMIGQVLVPMMLLALGARLSTSRITDVRVGVQSAVLTMGVRTLAAFVVLVGVPLQGVERGALLLFAALPPAVFNYMLADRFNQQPSQVASMVIVAHVTSLAFLPLGIWLAFL